MQGYNSCSAHEYEEDDDVFERKIELLSSLIQRSRNLIAYTGALADAYSSCSYCKRLNFDRC